MNAIVYFLERQISFKKLRVLGIFEKQNKSLKLTPSIDDLKEPKAHSILLNISQIVSSRGRTMHQFVCPLFQGCQLAFLEIFYKKINDMLFVNTIVFFNFLKKLATFWQFYLF